MVTQRGGGGTVPTVPAHLPVRSNPTPVKRRPPPGAGPLPDWWALLSDGTATGSKLGHATASAPITKAVLATDYLPWCYGQVRVSVPAIAYGTINPGESTWAEGQALIPWSEGPIQSIDTVYCQGNAVRAGFANDGYQTFDRLDFVGNAGELNSYIGGYFQSTLGKLAVANRVAGTYFHVHITAGWVYAGSGWWSVFGGTDSGATLEFAADVHGLKLYDPRLDSTNGGSGTHRENDETTWAYSNNPILIARDLYRRAAKLDSNTIDDASVRASATASDTAGFSCNIAFTEKTTLEAAVATVMQTCNGTVITANGKVGFFVDVVNAGAPVASFSEEDGDIWGLNYEWLSARDRYTQMAVSFQNRNAAYKSDVTSWFGDPGTFSSEPALTISSVNTGTDTFTLGVSPGWSVGDTVIFFQNGGAAIGGMNDGQTYYVKTISGPNATLSEVSGGATLDITGSPVVTSQYLQRVGVAYPPTVPLKQTIVNAPGVNTMAAAVILRDYLFNSQAITFRISGTVNSRGILLQQGQKITLETLKLAPADYLLLQITGDANGFFQFVVRPYSASVYSSTPITVQPPVVIPPANPQDPPADITVTDDTTTLSVADAASSNQQTFKLYQIIKYQIPTGTSAGAIASLVIRGYKGTGAHTKTWADMADTERQIPLTGNQPAPDSTHRALIFDPIVKTVRVMTFDQGGQLINTVDTTLDARMIIRTMTSAGVLSTGVTVDVNAATNTVTNPRTDVPRWTWTKPVAAVDGSRVTFAVPAAFVAGTLMVVRDGQVCVDSSFSPGDGHDYSVSGLNVTFVVAPQSFVAFFYQESVA